jgi:REase_DpnII-MboI
VTTTRSWKASQITFTSDSVNNLERQAEICARLAELRPALEAEASANYSYADILLALGQFMECIRYLNTRRSKGARLSLEGEADVQDTIYLMLRPWITDLVSENPTDKVGNRFAIKDFLARSARTVIEVKYIRDETHGKQISKEIHDDIEMYRHHPDCDHLIFFIYDPDSLIPNVAALNTEVAEDRVYAGRSLYCHLIVKP